jgi:hypothetical protein
MALNSYSGSFTITAGASSKAVTGLGFTPKLVIFWGGTSAAVTGSVASSMFYFGASTGNGNNHCNPIVRDQDNVGTSAASRTHSATHCIYKYNATGAVDYSATMTSFDADGFTIGIDDTPATDSVVCFLALGGTDITNVEVGTSTFDTTKTAGQTQDITLSGAFQPTSLIIATASSSSAAEGSSNDLYSTLGFTDGTSQFSATAWSGNGAAAATYRRVLSNTRIAFRENDASTAYAFNFNSFLSNGFRMGVEIQAPGAYKFMYIAIKGPRVFAGDFVANTTTADVTSESAACGFTPNTLFIMSATRTAYGSSADLSFAVGATTDTEANRAGANVMMGFAGSDTSDPTDSNTTTGLTICSAQIRTTGGTAGTNALKSFDTNGFTLYQGEASGSAIICPYLAFGSSGVGDVSENRAVGRGIMAGVGRGIM